ncbi:olfactory receptor 1G1-like [Xenopus laevis]|uniref:G-protein coupled receptors family 1 profile domain-containing protein n=2 Tax=Xenopus laevis TaxID=8355 RepID=A0A974DEK0_XENLA|nr:olfactory receptor 1G1-like [Xenopus laevis]OCT90238.1 hypothetical protein XELAEV_18018851mg [Xenopus laevis]
MDNQTSTAIFRILAFSSCPGSYSILSLVFFIIYLTGIMGNIIIITVIFVDSNLHTPMYFFLCNLSCADILFTTITLPKLMDILLFGNNSMSAMQCYSQMYLYICVASTEDTLLSFMAYDRYVAICKPLHYAHIMNKKKYVLLIVATWITGFLNSFFMTLLASQLTLCKAGDLYNFFCDVKAVLKVSCSTITFRIIIYVETLLFGFCPFLLSIISYIKIIRIILSIKSSNGRRKAFSTCSSHLTVLAIFYGTAMCMYMRPPSEHSEDLDQGFSVLYAAVTPMLNPLIYSLRNNEVKTAFFRIDGIRKRTFII